MTDELKPVRCGCGGEAKVSTWTGSNATVINDCNAVYCEKCGIQTKKYKTEAEAIEAWNRAMGERSAKGIEHDASITDTDGNKYFRTEYLCGACKKKVLGGDEYCSHCGCRLDWNEDIPMEYFESGGI